MLYPGNTKPLYEQLKNIIVEMITSGELKAGSSVPGERSLAERYGVSRATIRHAIGELVNEGILYRQHGKGTFVAQRKIDSPLATLLGVAEELEIEGVNVSIKPISSGFQIANSEVSQYLGIKTAEKVFMTCRIITVDNQPLLVNYSYMPQTVGYIIDKCDIKRDIYYNVLETYGYKINHADQRISSDSVSLEDAKYLEYKPNKPVLVVNRTTFVEGDRPIIFEKNIYRADRYEYKINLKRNRH